LLRTTVKTTLSLLNSDHSLIKSLASLSYHNYPYPIPNTYRRASHLPPIVNWNPRHPEIAKQRFYGMRREVPVQAMSNEAGETIVEVMRMAEKTTGAVMGDLLPKRSRHLHRR